MSPFYPQTDGMVEKFNHTFLNIIRNYVSESQDDYRTAINDTTGISPAEALQVRKLRLPIDVLRPPSLVFGGENENRSFDELLDKMKVIRSNIRSNAEKSLENKKSNYNHAKSHSIKSEFSINEKVYWKKVICKKGRCPKLSQIWQGPFVVKSKLSDLNYVTTDENGTKVTVHINNLKSCLNNSIETKRIRTRGRPPINRKVIIETLKM